MVDIISPYAPSLSLLKTVSDETRLNILWMLKNAEMNGCEINRAFACKQPTISYHMKLLVDSGLVCSRKEGCAVIYSINMETWPMLENLLQALCEIASKGETDD